MPSFRFSSRCLLTAFATILVFSFGSLPLAGAQTPSQDQIEAFQNMSPEQQQAILETMGGRGDSSSALRPAAACVPIAS